MHKICPKFNKNITEGSSPQILRTIPEFLDDIIKSSIRSLSPDVELEYLGYRRLTPKEEFAKMIANENNKTVYDLAVSDLYMVEYKFRYMGIEISRPLYLPFTTTGNLMHVSNTTYAVVPVLSDTVISPSHKEVFVRLLKDKLTFRSSTRNFIINNEKVPGEVIHSNIVKVNKQQLTDNIGKPMTAMSLYLLGEYGFKESMSRYVKIPNDMDTPYIVSTGDVTSLRDTYNVYESTKVKPRSLKEYGYIGHDLKICINKKLTVTPFLENFIFGIIYTFDILSDNASEFIKLYYTDNVQDEKLFWRIILGRITYTNTFSVNRIVADMDEHFYTLQGYLDNLVKTKLHENNIYVDNFFDLVAVIMDNYNIWLLNSKEYNSDISNRYIDILYYIAYDIIVGFNRVILNINKRNTRKALSLKEINKIFTNELSTRKIYSLVKSQSVNLSMIVAESTGDIMYPKITTLLEDQSRGNGVKRGTKSQFPESTKQLKGHDLALGSLLFLNKSAPTPRLRSNLYLQYNVSNGKLVIPKYIQKAIEKLDLLLTGRVENARITTFNVDDSNELK
jgi:hypothetical protein